jgi:hypothetical protein
VQRGEEASAQHEQVRGPSSAPTDPPPSPSSSSSPNPQSEIHNPKSDPDPNPDHISQLTDEDRLLEAVVKAEHTPADIARRFGIRLSLLTDWLAAPRIRARIAALLDAGEIVLLQQHRAARAKAIARLEKLMETSEDPVEVRRAATAITRASTRSLAFRPLASHAAPIAGAAPASPSHRRAAAADAASAHRLARLFGEPPAPVVLGPAPWPRTRLTPPQITAELLLRLQDNHNPAANSGIRALFNFLDQSCRGLLNTYELQQLIDADYDEISDLTSSHAFILKPVTYEFPPLPDGTQPTLEAFMGSRENEATAIQRFTFIDSRGRTRAGYFCFHIDRERIWRISDFNIDDHKSGP